ncbi:Wzz/FepE/Etk N-terminal domain-containing protein [Amylibacter sp.]|nr:Wzz/FepE/Etk N-terminal domain-containing protein [Amylibacter sp.]
MQDLISSESNDEIDLRELFIVLWTYKLFIAAFCALGIMFSGYYALNANKVFSSTAIFKLDQDNSDGIAIGGEIGALASLAGLSNGFNVSPISTDQFTGRIFIQSLDTKLNFQADPFFNTYNPNSIDPIWKSLIKRAIGWQKSSVNTQEAIWQGIVAKYSKNVVLGETKAGSFKIAVTHVNPQRAAKIANIIMEKIIFDSKNKKNTEQDQQLSYLSNSLAKALIDLETSQSNLKEFALENSALPLKSFTAGSFKLDALRDKLSQTSRLHEAVATLSLILQNKTADQNDYLELRQKFPIVDQVDFRRILGQSEIISSWSWPKASSVDAVFDTLTERKKMLQSQINASQINAERSRLALKTFAKLEREAKISEATYTVLIEQVKAQSVVAGFRPDRTEVYEYASASINPSAPRRSLILALGGALGGFLGAALSLILGFRRSVYYSKNSLKIGAKARLTASAKTLQPLRNKNFTTLKTMLMENSHPILRDIAVAIHKSNATQVLVTSSRAKMMGCDVARALASYMQSETMKVAVIDFSSKAKKLDVDIERLSVESYIVSETAGHISVLRPDGDFAAMELLSDRDFLKKTQSLNSTFDLVILCADNNDAISLLSALEGQNTFHITLARTKKTKSATIEQMRSLLPIQGLLHD